MANRALEDLAERHLDAELGWRRVALDVHSARVMRARSVGLGRGQLEPDEVEALVDAARRRDELVADLAAGDEKPPLVLLAERLGLNDDDRLLWAAAIGAEVDPAIARRFAQLDDHGARWPTLATLIETVIEPRRRLQVRGRLEPWSPLVRYELLVVDPRFGLDASGPLRPSTRLVRLARGEMGLDPSMESYGALWTAPDPRPMALSDKAREKFEWFAKGFRTLRAGGSQPLWILKGPVGVGRTRWVREAAAACGWSTLAIDLAGAAAWNTRDDGSHAAVLAEAMREARLQDAVLVLRGWDTLVDGSLTSSGGGGEDESSIGEKSAELVRRMSVGLEQSLREHPLPVTLVVGPSFDELPDVQRGLSLIEVPMPDAAASNALWARAAGPGTLADGVTPQQLTEAFRLTPGEIEAVATACERVARVAEKGVTVDEVRAEVKTFLRHRLRQIATLVEHRYDWPQLICPSSVVINLRSLVDRYRMRHKVMVDWKMGERFGEARGISVLFEGPPGTGKTMAANIIARELGLDLFQVDLSKVMSKYIGETEKHLGMLFDEAERAQALILFDEADSLFAKRTEVKDSHDRHANLKVNFLLQRIERFSGLAILTTNLAESIDEAFGRRVTVRVHFPKPELDMRVLLWKSMLDGLPQAVDDADIADLAKEFELTGGLIRNAVLRAAFFAASADRPIDYRLLEIATRMEQKNQSMLLRGDPMQDLMQTMQQDESG
ncbi:MAG: ATP-binding protein [Myxococcota bacterium]